MLLTPCCPDIWQAIYNLFDRHQELVLAALPLMVALAKTFKWGNALFSALKLVMDAVEKTGNQEIKQMVADAVAGKQPIVKDVVADAVGTVDPRKTTPHPAAIIVREAVRMKLKWPSSTK